MRRVGAGSVVALAAGVLPGAAPATAQRLGVELRAGAAVGNYTGTDAGLDIAPAPSFAVTVELGLTDALAGYVGFNRSSFGCTEALCATQDVSLTSQGFVAGGRYALGLLWARAGLAFETLHVASDAPTETSDPGLGWDLGAGLEIPVGAFRIRPGITYLRHGAETGSLGDGHVALLAAEVGFRVSF